MSKKTADQIASKYQRGVAGAGQDYLEGVSNPVRPWSQATQAGARRWASGVTAAIQSGAFAKGVAQAGDQKWQQNAIEKGSQRYSASATFAANAYSQVAGKIMAAATAAQQAVSALPDETQEQRIARAAAAMRAISAHWKR